MSLIQVDDLTFTYPGSYDPVFSNTSFAVDTDWKLGFVGRNGRGKTTLLRLLMGEYEYRGRISASVQFDYFPYPVPDGDAATGDVLRSICPDAAQWQMQRELCRISTPSSTMALMRCSRASFWQMSST